MGILKARNTASAEVVVEGEIVTGEAEVAAAAPAAALVQQPKGQVVLAPQVNTVEVELEGIEGGNAFPRIAMDGTDFLRKWLIIDDEETEDARVRELYFIVTAGKKLYQSWDENSNLCQSENNQKTSTDNIPCATCRFNKKFNPDVPNENACKMKYEIHLAEVVQTENGWQFADMDEESLDEEGNAQPRDVVWNMPTSTGLQFMDFVNKDLKKRGLSIGQVVVKAVVKRATNTNDKSIKYSKGDFTAIPLV
jgi:hypothetical protein